MNTGHLIVARELLREAARLLRWSEHKGTPADVEASPVRAEMARVKARAAFALVAAAKFPAAGNAST